MSTLEICLTVFVGLCTIIGTLCAWIFNTTIQQLKDDFSTTATKTEKNTAVLWSKYDEVRALQTDHTLADERRFGRIDAMLGVKDQQYSEIIAKIDLLTSMLKSVIEGRTTK